MRVSKILESIAKSKPGQKFYKWCASPGKDVFLNNTLPQIETVFATGCYILSTERQKNIDRDRKNLLQIQNVGSGIVGLAMGTAANHWVSKKADGIIQHLDPTKLDPKALRKVSTGLRVALPILSTAICMRFLIPTAIACFSGKAMDKVREKREQQKLDIKV